MRRRRALAFGGLVAALGGPAAVTVLGRDEIDRSGATTIPDLLRQVPGVQVIRQGPGNYIVSLRGTGGLTGNNLVVLVDGVPLNSRIDGSIDWAGLPVTPGDI